MNEDMPRTAKVDDKRLIQAGDKVEGPVFTAPDIADDVSMTVDGVRQRLKELEKNGKLNSRKVGARAIVWWPRD